ncbi:MAG: rhamnan synthesis F family protein [Lachnospiraceae bacterium]
MKNIYDIRKEKNLIYIFQEHEENITVSDDILKRSCVVINLYYEESIDTCMAYIEHIPRNIDVFIFSSNEEVITSIRRLNQSNVTVIQKDNRGRDVSALLVAFHPYYDKYEYICFLHDKKGKNEKTLSDTNAWLKNIWSNLLFSENYIYSVLNMFLDDKNIGIAVPPEPFGEYVTAWYSDAWENNFDNCVMLAQSLNLVCELNEEKSPMAISTAFWARTDAIKKIFEKHWTYDDFQEEPMPNDGTISHAIERIWGYLAQDAGYDIVTIMNKDYVIWELLNVQDASKQMFKLLKEKLYVHDLYEIVTFEDRLDKLKDFMEKNQFIYLYGAGKYGRDLLRMMRLFDLEPDGFCVTELQDETKEIDGLKVFGLSEVVVIENAGIIVSTKFYLHEEFMENMDRYNFKNYIIAY